MFPGRPLDVEQLLPAAAADRVVTVDAAGSGALPTATGRGAAGGPLVLAGVGRPPAGEP